MDFNYIFGNECIVLNKDFASLQPVTEVYHNDVSY